VASGRCRLGAGEGGVCSGFPAAPTVGGAGRTRRPLRPGSRRRSGAARLAFPPSGGDGCALLAAYDTGRGALALSVCDLTAAQHAALLASTLGPRFQESARRRAEDGERRLARALVPFETVTRGVSEVDAERRTRAAAGP
jgi:hypothetical protein